MRTELVLDALEMGNGLRRPGEGLIAHSDRGSQYTSMRYTERLDQLGAAPSVGSRGDAYDNAMAEAHRTSGAVTSAGSIVSSTSWAGSRFMRCPAGAPMPRHFRASARRWMPECAVGPRAPSLSGRSRNRCRPAMRSCLGRRRLDGLL
jgi:hypothetical protein